MRQPKDHLAQLIVSLHQLANGRGREPLEKTAQAGWVGQLFQSQQVQKETIILHLVRLVEPLNPGDQKKDQHLDDLDRTEADPRRSIPQKPLRSGGANPAGYKIAESERSPP